MDIRRRVPCRYCISFINHILIPSSCPSGFRAPWIYVHLSSHFQPKTLISIFTQGRDCSPPISSFWDCPPPPPPPFPEGSRQDAPSYFSCSWIYVLNHICYLYPIALAEIILTLRTRRRRNPHSHDAKSPRQRQQCAIQEYRDAVVQRTVWRYI